MVCACAVIGVAAVPVPAGVPDEVAVALMGQGTTAHYLTSYIQRHPVTVTQLAQGIPIGSDLDYLDEGTLAAAIKSRRTL